MTSMARLSARPDRKNHLFLARWRACCGEMFPFRELRYGPTAKRTLFPKVSMDVPPYDPDIQSADPIALSLRR